MKLISIVLISAAFFLTACSGSDSSSETEVEPQPIPFSISLSYPLSVKAGEPFSLNLNASSGHSVSESSIINNSRLVAEIESISDSEFVISIPILFEQETFEFSVTAVNEQGLEVQESGEVAITLNRKPRNIQITQVGSVVENNQSYQFEYEVFAEDEDGIGAYEMAPANEKITTQKLSDNRFSLSLSKPLGLNSAAAGSSNDHFEGASVAVSDTFGQSSIKALYLSVPRKPGIDIEGQTSALVASEEYYRVEAVNIDPDLSIQDIEWSQVAGDPVSIEVTERQAILVEFDNKNYSESLAFRAEATLSNGDVFSAIKTVNVLESVGFSSTPLSREVASDLISAQNTKLNHNPNLDVNGDGLIDEVLINNGVIQLNLAQPGGDAVFVEDAGKFTLHQFTTTDWGSLDMEQFRQSIEAKPLSMVDVDGDGLKDLIVEVNMELENRLFYFWVKAVDQESPYFSGDYSFNVSGLYPWRSNLIDVNGDGIKDYIGVNTITLFEGPSTFSTRPDNTVNANPFCCKSLDSIKELNDHVYVRDLDGDGNPELISHVSDTFDTESGRSWLRVRSFNSNTQSFDTGKTMFFGDNYIRRLALLDIDSNGLDEIVVAVGSFDNYQVIVPELWE